MIASVVLTSIAWLQFFISPLDAFFISPGSEALGKGGEEGTYPS
jgi:hypothetical protein